MTINTHITLKDLWSLYQDLDRIQGLIDYFYGHATTGVSAPSHLIEKRRIAKEMLVRALLDSGYGHCVTVEHGAIRDLISPVYRPNGILTEADKAFIQHMESKEVT